MNNDPRRYRLADYLTRIAPYLPPELVSAAALSRIQLIAQTLPPSWGTCLGCHLGANTAQVDFSVHLLDNTLALTEGIQYSPIWQRIQQLCLDCANPNSRLGQEAVSIWLEFNLDREPSEMPIPNVFLSLPDGQSFDESGNSIDFRCWLTEKVIEPLLGDILCYPLRQNLRLCWHTLPMNAQVLYLGVMLSRANRTLQVNISGISPLVLADYLEQTGWSGSRAKLDAIALKLYPLVDRIVVNLEIGVTMANQISLECFVDRRLDKNAQWQPLLNYLVENQLCTPEKRDALLRCSGFGDEQSSPVLLPPNVRMDANFLGTRASSSLVRELNHIELTLHSSNQCSAKGFLWLGSDWRQKSVNSEKT